MFFTALKSLPTTEAHFTQLYTTLEPRSHFTLLHVEQVLEGLFVFEDTRPLILGHVIVIVLHQVSQDFVF